MKIDLDLDKLENDAKAATPGPWAWRHFGKMTEPPILVADHGNRHVIIADAVTRCRTNGDLIPMYQDQPNADYIANMNPQTTLALIARLRKAEHVVEAAKAMDQRLQSLPWHRLNHDDEDAPVVISRQAWLLWNYGECGQLHEALSAYEADNEWD